METKQKPEEYQRPQHWEIHHHVSWDVYNISSRVYVGKNEIQLSENQLKLSEIEQAELILWDNFKLWFDFFKKYSCPEISMSINSKGLFLNGVADNYFLTMKNGEIEVHTIGGSRFSWLSFSEKTIESCKKTNAQINENYSEIWKAITA